MTSSLSITNGFIFYMNHAQIKQYSDLNNILGNMKNLLPGLLLIALIVIVSTVLVELEIGQSYGLSPLIYSILLGMLVGNTFFNKISDTTSPPRTKRNILPRLISPGVTTESTPISSAI